MLKGRESPGGSARKMSFGDCFSYNAFGSSYNSSAASGLSQDGSFCSFSHRPRASHGLALVAQQRGSAFPPSAPTHSVYGLSAALFLGVMRCLSQLPAKGPGLLEENWSRGRPLHSPSFSLARIRSHEAPGPITDKGEKGVL